MINSQFAGSVRAAKCVRGRGRRTTRMSRWGSLLLFAVVGTPLSACTANNNACRYPEVSVAETSLRIGTPIAVHGQFLVDSCNDTGQGPSSEGTYELMISPQESTSTGNIKVGTITGDSRFEGDATITLPSSVPTGKAALQLYQGLELISPGVDVVVVG